MLVGHGKIARMLVLFTLFTSIAKSTAENTVTQLMQDPSTYFASTNNDAYLDWFMSNNRASYYSNSVFLSSPNGPENGAAIHWSIDEKNIYLAVATRATGWAGFGIAENGGMKGADMVLYTAANNKLTDAHVLDDIYEGPMEDDCQSWTLQNTQTRGGFLIFEATRLLDTNDPQDRPIVNDTSLLVSPARVIAAWGDTPTVSYHEPTSRVKSSIRFHGSSNTDNEHDVLQKSMEGFLDTRAQDYPIKPIETEYAHFCFSLSDLLKQGMPADEELHIIGIEPMIDRDTARYVHHFVVYGQDQDWEESGQSCEAMWSTPMYGWAPGQKLFLFPENVGAPLGNNGDVSFQVESKRCYICTVRASVCPIVRSVMER